MKELSPCGSSLSSCGTVTNGNVPNPVDQISVFTFPAVSSATPDYCGGGSISVQPYPLPTIGGVTTSPTYQIVNFSSDYRTSDGATSLSTTSNLSKAAGTSGTGCSGLQDPGGEGTYYPAVIYDAAELLLNQQTSRGTVNGVPTTQNALIILGDGDANATQSHMGASATNKGTYPSWVDQCQQAIAATQWATGKGITVYSVAYDAQGSGTCSTDTSSSSPINEAGISACQTMEQLASKASKFYTSNSSCQLSGGNTVMSLNAIFTAIAGDMTVARLVPNGTH